MAKSALDRLKDATTGAFGLGRTVAGHLVKTAGPKVVETAGVVRSHLPRHRPAASAPATPEAGAPQAPPRTKPAPAKPQTGTGNGGGGGDTVTPADIARNIPKHPPTRPAAKKPATRKPATKAVPGAKLPAKKAAAQPDKS